MLSDHKWEHIYFWSAIFLEALFSILKQMPVFSLPNHCSCKKGRNHLQELVAEKGKMPVQCQGLPKPSSRTMGWSGQKKGGQWAHARTLVGHIVLSICQEISLSSPGVFHFLCLPSCRWPTMSWEQFRKSMKTKLFTIILKT